MTFALRCWVCGTDDLFLRLKTNIGSALTSSDFAVTDHRYGTVASIYQCRACGFLECPDVGNPTAFYEALEDPEYEAGRPVRSLQARALLRRLIRLTGDPAGRRLLDVGAGSGILVEEAMKLGFDAEGVEPSVSLQGVATRHGLPVHLGTLDSSPPHAPYDAVTLVDVIEHVSTPAALVQEIAGRLAPGGVAMIVTPDVRSIAARVMGWRWWHFRIAHIGYFSNETLAHVLNQADLRVVEVFRPGWVFTLSYLLARLGGYLPSMLRVRPRPWMDRVRVPLNLLDSLCVVAQKPLASPPRKA